MPSCPHANVVHCPLYVAAHEPSCNLSCDDGRLGEGGCAVDRGLDYEATVEKLRIIKPRLVALCEFAEAESRALEQISRNKRLAGVH